MEDPLEERQIGAVTVLFGAKSGKYPQGNTLAVRGTEEALVIDPSLGMLPRADALPPADRVVNSHCHEDHIAGNHLFPDVPWHLHEADLPGIRSFEAMMAIYGLPDEADAVFGKQVLETFHFTPREDALGYSDGDVFDLGGGVRVRVIHAPGHTRGHCFLHVEPDDVLYLADVDLSSFGPYYGDAWSDLEDFERTIELARKLEARHYATFHHIGVLDERDAYLARLERFAARIQEREQGMLAFLAEPHTLEEIAGQGFIYRSAAGLAYAMPAERRSMGQHVERLLASGRVEEVEPGRYRVAG